MNKELRELLKQINNKKAEAKSLLEQKNLDKAKEVSDEIENLRKEFEIQSALLADDKEDLAFEDKFNDKTTKADEMEAFNKVIRGETLTAAENAMLTGDGNSENYLVPKDVHTQITELRREYKSAKDLVGNYPTTTLEGSFVYESNGKIVELENFTDGETIPDSDKPQFKTVSYSVKDYGALLPVSRKLLKNETGGLVTYLGKWFNKKAIQTENTKIFAELKKDKTPKVLKGYSDLKTSINKDLDPTLQIGMRIITNQDGFEHLDNEKDGFGRPILEPNPVNKTQKMINGTVIEVFSNATLPTEKKKAPIFYGATTEGVTFVEREQMQLDMSDHALFNKNQVALRLIESFDVIPADKEAYVYGQIDLTATPEPTPMPTEPEPTE
ncbi:hypothetical protein ASG46_10165 [Bacillus sp. Leaf49]|uniref:phage major capsid protein n=1 Tax=Bacillus sp. Leaf49 TaxID=1736222 RepID=UPI0006F29FB5|nr:phage major capsid protein [Bacillus sp. Leaf49]KQU11560.1 hypothetical protein ASG46_10165 [Bacillus sp. Leaf49]